MTPDDFHIDCAYRNDVQTAVTHWCVRANIRLNQYGYMNKSLMANLVTTLGREADFFKLAGVTSGKVKGVKLHGPMIDRRAARIPKPPSFAADLFTDQDSYHGLKVSRTRLTFNNPDHKRPSESDEE